MKIDEPIHVSNVDSWDQSADVVVVGLGVAGACAALEAHRAGAEVLVVERASGGGGASATSEGTFYLGGGTAMQEACSVADDPDEMYKFMRASTTTPDDEALRLFCDGGREHFDWLEAQGVPFERQSFTAKAVAVRTGEGLMSSGNEHVWPFSEAATPAMRGHQTRSHGRRGGGATAMNALLATVVDEGLPVLYDAGVTGLVVDDSGVCGVRVRQPAAADRFVQARHGAIIATGSFNLNPEMTTEHFPVVAKHGRPLGIDSNDGVGLHVAQTVGVSTRAMDGVIATSSIYPPEQLLFGIIVNANGERFVAEDAYHGRTSYFIERQPNQVAYLIVDEAHFAYPDRGQDLIDVWDTVAELELALSMPPGTVEATLTSYNAGVADGEDHDFHKHSRWMAPLQPPLAAFDLSFARADYSFISLGGLQSDLDGRAIDAAGNAVPGLYAVGAVAAHLPQNGAEYASGMSLGPGSFFGRRAGRHAAARRS